MATTDLSIHSAEYSLRNPAAGSAGRLLCVDIYRGLMVAGMIIVDNPGSDEHACLGESDSHTTGTLLWLIEWRTL